MSVRAYHVKNITLGEEVFNLWHDEEFAEILYSMGLISSEDGGWLEITKRDFEKIKEEAQIREFKVDEIIEKLEKLFAETEDDYLLFHYF